MKHIKLTSNQAKSKQSAKTLNTNTKNKHILKQTQQQAQAHKNKSVTNGTITDKRQDQTII